MRFYKPNMLTWLLLDLKTMVPSHLHVVKLSASLFIAVMHFRVGYFILHCFCFLFCSKSKFSIPIMT